VRHQGFEIAILGAVELFEDAVGNGPSALTFRYLLAAIEIVSGKRAECDTGVGAAETGESVALGRATKREG